MSAESGEGEHVVTLETEERMKECGSRGELGDVGVLAGGGEENQDQEVRAQKGRREHGEEERRHRQRACVIYNFIREGLPKGGHSSTRTRGVP